MFVQHIALYVACCRCVCAGHVAEAQAAPVLPDKLPEDRQPVSVELSMDWNGVCAGCKVNVAQC